MIREGRCREAEAELSELFVPTANFPLTGGTGESVTLSSNNRFGHEGSPPSARVNSSQQFLDANRLPHTIVSANLQAFDASLPRFDV